MAGNTIMTAKNSFQEGLVMDFAPDNTQANVLTSALNATLLTFNGNEMSLQNDMGNGRVETAHLPEGYIPVGTCEFGDIIYIVSYNPLTDKAQIGCFPSPERNISSEEDDNNTNVSLSANDFQELNEIGKPTGELKTSSIKKILFQNDLHPGDKYVIYAENINKDDVKKTLSDHGNSDNMIGKFPKFLKVRIVSIEESGKITYIDSNVKWYNNDYYIQEGKSDGVTLKPDLDSYRSLVNSAYNTFASKVSGKLALLIELEKITGFSHSWEVYETESNDEDITYNVYFNFSWTTDSTYINPSGIHLTKNYWKTEENNKFSYKVLENGNWNTYWNNPSSNPDYHLNNIISISRTYEPENEIYKQDTEFKNLYLNQQNANSIKQNYKNYLPECGWYTITTESGESRQQIKDDVVNNIYKYPITKSFIENLKIPIKRNGENVNMSDIIYNYEITPAMPYGLLREFSQKGQIDFSKIGKENIKLHTWKYYNTSDTCTLTWGMDAYTSPGKIVSSVEFKFYDHDHGHVATLISDNKRSYNGIFTDYFSFNMYGSHPKLKLIDFKTDDKTENYPIKNNDLYLIEINIYQSFKQADGTLLKISDPTHTEYRWMWTNEVFNKYYNQVSDYNLLQLELELDCGANFSTNERWEMITEKQPLNINDLSIDDPGLNILINKQKINSNGSNVNMYIVPGLQNNYETFRLASDGDYKIRIILGDENIENNPEQPNLIDTDNTGHIIDLNSELSTSVKDKDVTYMHLSGYNFSNNFNNEKDTDYINSNGEFKTNNNTWGIYKTSWTDLYDGTLKSIPLQFEASHCSKYCCIIDQTERITNVLRPFIYSKTDLRTYGLQYSNNRFQFDKMFFGTIDNEWDTNNKSTYTYSIVSLSDVDLKEPNTPGKEGDTVTIADVISSGYKEYSSGDVSYITLNQDVTKDDIKEHLPLFFPYSIGYNSNQLNEYIDESNNTEHSWSKYRTTEISVSNSNDSSYDDNFYILNNSSKIANTKLEITSGNKSQLAGTLAIKNEKGNILVTSAWQKNGITGGYVNNICELLMNLYYVSSDVNTISEKYIKSLIYLDSNYTTYTRDVAIDVSVNNQSINNLMFNEIKLSDYFKDLSTDVNKSNITPILLSCKKVIPLQFKINYITPTTEVIGHENKTLIQSVINMYNGKYTSDILEKNTIYGISGINPETGLVDVKSIDNLQGYTNINLTNVTLNDNSIFEYSVDNQASSTKLNGYLKERLAVQDGNLYIPQEVTAMTTNTYSLATSTFDSKNNNITGFPKNTIIL